MENQYNFPKNNFSDSLMKKKLFLFTGLVVVVAFVFALFFAFDLGRREVLSQKAISNIQEVTKKTPVVPEKTASSTKTSFGGHVAVGAETEVTPDERKNIGVPDFVKLKAVRRDSTGRVVSFEILVDPNDPIDSDNDGVPDKQEGKLGTNPNKVDTDGDGVSDYQELTMGTDPKVMNNFNKK